MQKHVDKIGARLDVSNFNELFSFAINQDISPLRMKCLYFAERHDAVHDKFAANELSPEVIFALQAVWKVPTKPATRKRRFFEAE